MKFDVGRFFCQQPAIGVTTDKKSVRKNPYPRLFFISFFKLDKIETSTKMNIKLQYIGGKDKL